MAGMLPGVESARRRRCRGSDSSSIHNPGFASGRVRFSSDTHLLSPSILDRSTVNQSDQDEKLAGAARQAKERLDGRLRGYRKTALKRQNAEETLTDGNAAENLARRPNAATVTRDLQTEVFGSKKIGLRRFGWGKMRLIWKSSGYHEECAICLDRFKAREKIFRVPCGHRFHAKCLLPWVERNAQCPYCRAEILRSG